MIKQKMCSEPIFFKRNRVYRVYLGGRQYAKLMGDKPEDTLFPEEWICSKVKAINKKQFGKRDGVSIVENTDIFFDDLLHEHEEELLGGKKYDCLVKFLDSAIRLPVQVHPTKAFSRKYFNSEYGKTEAWLVIDTRPDAKVYLGFNRKVTKEELSELEERSLSEREIMETILSAVPAKVGDIYLIPAGMIHALGAGCTVIEVQEPTDFTIQPENWCGDERISEQEKYLGLDKSTALDCFDYDLMGEKALNMAKITPKTVFESNGYRKETLITYEDTPCFSENRHTLSGGTFVMEQGPSVYIVTDGQITIKGKNYERTTKKGEYFFLPFIAENKFSLSGNGTVIECLPSKNQYPET